MGDSDHEHMIASPANLKTSPPWATMTSIKAVKYKLICLCKASTSRRVLRLVNPEISTKRRAVSKLLLYTYNYKYILFIMRKYKSKIEITDL